MALECNPDCNGLHLILEDTKAICPHFHGDCGILDALQDAFKLVGWCTELGVRIPVDGTCPITLETLQAVHPCEAELRNLLLLIEGLAIEGSSQRKLNEWASFKEWLKQ